MESLAKEEHPQGRRGLRLSDLRRDERLQACRSRQNKVPHAGCCPWSHPARFRLPWRGAGWGSAFKPTLKVLGVSGT